jgi:hypothetical protein
MTTPQARAALVTLTVAWSSKLAKEQKIPVRIPSFPNDSYVGGRVLNLAFGFVSSVQPGPETYMLLRACLKTEERSYIELRSHKKAFLKLAYKSSPNLGCIFPR